MSYLTPVYQGDDKGFVGSDKTGVPGAPPPLILAKIRGARYLKSARYTATVTAKPAVGWNANRRTTTLKNEGANDVFIGGEDLNATNGYRLGAGDAITLEIAGEIWVVTAATNEPIYILMEVDE